MLVILLAGVAHADAVLVAPGPVAGWEQWRVTEGAEQVTAYVQHDERTLPLVVFAHCMGLFGEGHASLPFDAGATRKRADFQLAVVDCTEPRGKDARARAIALATRGLRTQPWVARVVLAGDDEGADVAAAALRYLAPADVGALGLFAGGGISHLFGTISEGRRAGDAQQRFAALLAMPDPAAESTPLDDLVPSSVPVFVTQGTRDPRIDSADALVVELLRRNAHRVIRYVVLDGVDRDLRAADGTHGEELLAEFVKWSTTPAGRTVETRVFVPGAAPARARTSPATSSVGMKLWLLVVLVVVGGVGAMIWRHRRRR